MHIKTAIFTIIWVSFCTTRPTTGHYFPSLHQLKYEVEDGITPNSRPVRFGFDPRNFPRFSWRGYAIMSPAQVSTHLLQLLGHCYCITLTHYVK